MKKMLLAAATLALIAGSASAAPEAFNVDATQKGNFRATPPSAEASETVGTATWTRADAPGRPMMQVSDDQSKMKKKRHHRKKPKAAPAAEAPAK